MLEPGSWMEITSESRVRHGRFFEFPLYREPNLRGEEAYEAVDAAVTAAVRRQVVCDVPVGTFLSGGIDSPLVAAKMRAATNGPVRAFTIGTKDRKSTRLNSSHITISYAVFCLKKKKI